MHQAIPNIIQKKIYSTNKLKIKKILLLIFLISFQNTLQAKDADGGYILASIERINKRAIRKTCQYSVDKEYKDEHGIHDITSKGFVVNIWEHSDFYDILNENVTVFNNQECDEKIAIHFNSLTREFRLIPVPKNITYSTYYYEKLNNIQAYKKELALQEKYNKEYEQELAIAKRNIPILNLNFESKNLINKIKEESWGNRGFLATNKSIYFNLDSSKLSTVVKNELMNRNLSCSFTLLDNDTVLATHNHSRFYVDDDFIMKSTDFFLGQFYLPSSDGDLIKRIQLGNILDLSCKIPKKSDNSSFYDYSISQDPVKDFKAKKRNVEVDDFRLYFRYK